MTPNDGNPYSDKSQAEAVVAQRPRPARCIEVSFGLDGKAQVTPAKAIIAPGEVVIWRIRQPGTGFKVHFKGADPGSEADDPQEGPASEVQDVRILSDMVMDSTVNHVAEIGVDQHAQLAIYPYAVLKTPAPAPPSSYPFSIIIREPQIGPTP